MPITKNSQIFPSSRQPVSTIVAPNQAWESTKKRQRRVSIIREFALNTSTHALPGIARSQSKHNRIFWSISFAIFTGVMSYFVTQTIINYFQYPTQTSVSIVIERSPLFPAVTVCNISPVRADTLLPEFFNYTDSMNITHPNQTRTINFRLAQLLRQYLIEKVNRNQSIKSYFFPLEKLLISCFYNNVRCTAADFITFESSNYGHCFTFNARTKNTNYSRIRTIHDYGSIGFLQLRLYAHSHLYVPTAADEISAGMVTMIHDNTELPLIDVAGIHLIPGRKHRLTYRKKTSYFLQSPYTDCTDKIPLSMQAMFDQYIGADFAYSQDVCRLNCKQSYTYDRCGCVDPYDWSRRSVVLPDSERVIIAPLCNVTDPCFGNATYQLSQNMDLWEYFCADCKRQCSSTEFLVTPSSAKAPADLYAYLTKLFVENSSLPLPANWNSDWPTEIQNNYVALDVMCQSSVVENFTQEASLSAVDVLSNVGGHTGLWIGISFLSIMEFVEMLYRLLRHEIFNLRRRLRQRIMGENNDQL